MKFYKLIGFWVVLPAATRTECFYGRKMGEVLKNSLWFLCISTWNCLSAFLKCGNVWKRYLLWITSLSGTEYSKHLNLCAHISTLDFLFKIYLHSPTALGCHANDEICMCKIQTMNFFMLKNKSTSTYKCICNFYKNACCIYVSTF